MNGRSAATVVTVLLALSVPHAVAGPAVNQFEVKNLSNEPGELEFQSQNAHAIGHPRRKFIEEAPGEFEYDGNALVRQRHALEMEATLTRYLRTRIGIEYESERLDDPATFAEANSFAPLRLTEIALEGVVILVPVNRDGIGIGALVEFQKPIGEPEEAATLFFGPILQARYGRWDAVANLMLVKYFRGGELEPGRPGRDEKLDFAYAAHLQYKVSDAWTLSLEGYGTVDRLGNSGTRDEAARLFGDHDQHRLGPVVYYTFKTAALGAGPKGGPKARAVAAASDGDSDRKQHRHGKDDDADDDDGASVRLGVGLLLGLNSNTPDHTLKWSVEVEF
jgi:hypothetical protein